MYHAINRSPLKNILSRALRKVNSDQSFPLPRDVRKKLFRLRIWSPRYKYENIFKTQHPKPNTPENVNVKENTVKTTTVTDVRIGVMNVQSLGNKLDCVIDHITDNRIDIVGITETWLSNDDKNNMSVVNTCLNNGYTLLHRPRNTGRRGGGVGVLINNQINVNSRMIGVNPEITSFESMEVVITVGSITIRLSVIYHWLDTNGSERKQFCNILETLKFVQNICTETHRSHHLLDFIITRKDCTIVSDFLVSDFISDHRALHASLQCIRPHPVRKQISVRAIRRIKDDAIVKDLDKFSIDQRCVDVDTMVEMYDRFLSELLDKHVPLKKITVVDRPLNEFKWMTDNILALKAIRRKNELIWRKTRITINFNIYYDSCMAVKKAISIRKAELMEQNVINCEGNQRKLFSLIHSLFGSKKITVLPEYTSSFTLASSINMFFIEKIHNIKMEFPLLEACQQRIRLLI